MKYIRDFINILPILNMEDYFIKLPEKLCTDG